MAGVHGHYLHRLGGAHLQEEAAQQIPAYAPGSRKGWLDSATAAQQPFIFNRNRIDWRVLHGVNLHLLAKHQDVEALDRCLNAGLAHGDLEAEDPSTLTLTNVLRVARLCQLSIQYFIATQDSLVAEVAALQTGKDAADAERAKTEDRLHLLKDKYKQAQSKLQSLRELVQQLESLPQPALPQPSQERRRTSEPVTQVPPPVRTEGWSKEELRQELQNFYDMLSSTVSSSQDEISRLHSTLSSKEAQLSAADGERQALQRRLDGEHEAACADRDNLAALHKKYAVMERSVGLMKDEIHRLRRRPAAQPDPSWESTISGQRGRISQLEDELGSTKRLYEQAAQHARDLEGEGGSLQADIQALEGRNAKLKEELARTQRERDQLLHRCNDAKKAINKLEHLVEQHRLNEPRLQEELRRLKDNYEALAKKQKESQSEHEREVTRLQRQVEEGNRQLLAAKRDMDLAKQDMDNARLDMDHARNDIDHYISSRSGALS